MIFVAWLKDNQGMGLRERKKEKTRRAIQETAMRLFKKHGYAETTIEQIAAATEISPATFYRYFPDKEDVALSLDYPPFVAEVIDACCPSEGFAGIVQAVYRHLAEWFEADRELLITRYRLMEREPDLKARRGLKRQAVLDFLASALAPRFGVREDHHELRLALAIAVAAESETVRYWAEKGGKQELGDLLEDAYQRILPALSVPIRVGRTRTAAKTSAKTGKGLKCPVGTCL